MAWGGGAFHTKLLFVVLLCGLVGYMQATLKKVRRTGDARAMARLPVLGRIGLAMTLAIVILAVVAFK
jgi:uncharacterized membrane protein